MCIYVYMCIARIKNRIKIRLQTNSLAPQIPDCDAAAARIA